MAIADRARATVYTKDEWSDAWVERPHLEPLVVRDCLQPQMPFATLHYRYGDISQPGQDGFSAVSPLDIEWDFVKIIWTGQSGTALRWYGVITDVQYSVMPVASGDTAAGDQMFRAQGLPFLLDMFPLYIAKGANFTDGQNDPLTLGWAPTFNLRDGSTQLLGNGYHWGSNVVQFGAPNYRGTYEWTFREIVEYLLREFGATGTIWGPTWSLVDDALSGDLDNLVEVVEQEGRTIRQVINRLIRPQRGYAWYATVPENESGVRIQVVGISPSAISAGGVTFHANANQTTWSFADDQDIAGRPSVTRALSARYDYVAVLGHRVITCFSLSHTDRTLGAGWHKKDADAYQLPASGWAGYDDLSPQQQQEHNRALRNLDRLTYSYYVVPNDWDWQAGDGEGGTKYKAQPLVYSDGNGIDPALSDDYMSGRGWYRFLPWLPLREGVVYSNLPYPAPSVQSERGFLKPMAFVKDSTSGRWCYASAPEDESIGPAKVRVDDKEMGIHVRFDPPHIIAMQPGGTGPWGISAYDTIYNGQTLVVTVAVETDHRLRIIEAAPSPALSTAYRVMAIYLDNAHLWYTLPNTVVGVDADGALQGIADAPKGMRIFRDDSLELLYIAKLSAAWYGRDKAAVDVTYRKLDEVKALGALITTVDCGGGHELTANSLVSQVTWDFSPGRGTTRYVTDFYELETSGFLQARGAPRWWRQMIEQSVDRQREAPEPSLG